VVGWVGWGGVGGGVEGVDSRADWYTQTFDFEGPKRGRLCVGLHGWVGGCEQERGGLGLKGAGCCKVLLCCHAGNMLAC
jgi:hypothetical protein